MSDEKTNELSADIEALSPPDKLRLAAELLENQRPELALIVIEQVAGELGAVLALPPAEEQQTGILRELRKRTGVL